MDADSSMRSASSSSAHDDETMDETLDIFGDSAVQNNIDQNLSSDLAESTTSTARLGSVGEAPPSPTVYSKGPSSTTPTSANAPLGLNENGKRVMFESDGAAGGPANGADGVGILTVDPEALAGSSRVRDGQQSGRLKKEQVHEPSGYTWKRMEDAPGWAWQNKKAQEDFKREIDFVIGQEMMIGNKYGELVPEETIPGS